jgi:hypothetical protein
LFVIVTGRFESIKVPFPKLLISDLIRQSRKGRFQGFRMFVEEGRNFVRLLFNVKAIVVVLGEFVQKDGIARVQEFLPVLYRHRARRSSRLLLMLQVKGNHEPLTIKDVLMQTNFEHDEGGVCR